MTKGFGKPLKDRNIYVESMVRHSDFSPCVKLTWGDEAGIFDSAQARHHAYAVLEAIAAAELDACLVQWLTQKIGITQDEAGQVLLHFREKRETNAIPSVTLNIGGEHLRPDSAREYATWLMDAAFTTELEAFLVTFALQDLNQPAEFADQLIQEFREMRGATTMWAEDEDEEGDRNA